MTVAGRACEAAGTRKAVSRTGLLVGGLVLLAVVAVLSIGIGARSVAPGEVVRALFDYQGSHDDHVIVRDVRAPRALLAIAVGAALAVAGALIQTLARNPLAEPGILGVTAGAGFSVTIGSALGLTVNQAGELGFAVVGSVVAALLVVAVGRHSPLRLVLAGVALTAVLNGVALGLRLMLPDTFDAYRFWSVGSLAAREQAPMALPMTVIALALTGALLLSRALNALSLGETVAHTLGANVGRVRIAALVLITVLSGAATAVAGPILFVGLIVPHLVRRPAGGSVPWLVLYTMVLGPILLLVADIGSRVLLPTGEVPVAIVTAFLGGPMLIWAVRRYGAGSL
ncbi:MULTISPECIES: iron chelate uptake ABC transporter family permease subunit [unclassified Streptomyces]|uniref:iron chelate uptake ABC transporter family permease subunit n=1 Tax=unclassified Streptomyces TaxID=2593676 RepID=UPI00136A32FB|nr:iron chelate uptake ABC transporter family permease subunit [Streptomyces sp. SID335]MYZ14544.1 iron chelate uptake ABC transporter family permease subunit [Streptomyces sp. SID337]NDZ91211.1 iron chelate uptake ABC transporter family permease subunit [Streptomyces sp. SID10115]NDZ98773.1 iron chelate uptake ABC transporter family permease subunit [Streptomyces sp. SID10116]NEB46096.1 iron chelate uptake ABC transporter family permease subunit [Streptomyces sp. SID339]